MNKKPERVKKVDPPIKYPGGKRFLVDEIKVLWQLSQSKRIVEPFSGGMAVSLGISPKKTRLNDLNQHVINFYQQIKAGLIIDIEMKNNEKFYYERRKQFNELIKNNDFNTPLAASLFYYLNRTTFNGLVRFSNCTGFNVGFGRYKTINYRRSFNDVQKTIRNWQFTSGDFSKIRVNKTDFLYVDPPYDTKFNNYSGKPFNWPEQERLIKHLKKYECPIVISNQATDRILELYKQNNYKIILFDAPRKISCNGNRSKAQEVLAIKNI